MSGDLRFKCGYQNEASYLVNPTMRIAVDLDSVLADTMATFCRILNERHSTQYTVESFTQWNAWQIADITKDEFFRTLDEAWLQWQTVPATEEKLTDKVKLLRSFGKVDIVTGRSQETVPYATLWLKEHRISYDEFVRTESTRAKVKLNYDVYIDDSADLMSLIASRLGGSGILYSQPWNRKAPDMPKIFRVERWEQIPKVLQELTASSTE
jgi:uncharacterized HAD superfamily protein